METPNQSRCSQGTRRDIVIRTCTYSKISIVHTSLYEPISIRWSVSCNIPHALSSNRIRWQRGGQGRDTSRKPTPTIGRTGWVSDHLIIFCDCALRRIPNSCWSRWVMKWAKIGSNFEVGGEHESKSPALPRFPANLMPLLASKFSRNLSIAVFNFQRGHILVH